MIYMSIPLNYILIFIIVSIPSSILGFMFILLGKQNQKDIEQKIINCALKKHVKIIDIISSYPFRRKRVVTYHLVFEYKDGDQNFVRKIQYKYFNPSQYKIGQELEIYFNPQNEDEYYIEGDNKQKRTSIILYIIGMIPIIFTVLLIITLIIRLLIK